MPASPSSSLPTADTGGDEPAVHGATDDPVDSSPGAADQRAAAHASSVSVNSATSSSASSTVTSLSSLRAAILDRPNPVRSITKVLQKQKEAAVRDGEGAMDEATKENKEVVKVVMYKSAWGGPGQRPRAVGREGGHDATT